MQGREKHLLMKINQLFMNSLWGNKIPKITSISSKERQNTSMHKNAPVASYTDGT